VATAVLVRGGAALRWVPSDERAPPWVAIASGNRPEPGGAGPDVPSLPDEIRAQGARYRDRGAELYAMAAPIVRGLTPAGLPARVPDLELLRDAREVAWRPPPPNERAEILRWARAELDRRLSSPEETLVALAREEERVERATRREEGAHEQWVSGDSATLRQYSEAWTGLRAAFAEHHAHLRRRLEERARDLAPNLSAVVGGRVAGRLVAAAGGLSALGRLSAPRLQLLGARRRPTRGRGPRYGLLYRAERMEEVPAGRRGAYARSLAALAVVAARADASTRRDLSGLLVGRRDRRVERLRARR
jgi:hypothetical protein